MPSTVAQFNVSQKDSALIGHIADRAMRAVRGWTRREDQR